MAQLLIAEYDGGVRNLLRLALRDIASHFLMAHSAADALRLVERRRPDAMLLQFELRDIPCPEVLARIRDLQPNLRVVVTAGFGYVGDPVVQREAFHVFLKPFELPKVRVVLRAALAGVERSPLPQTCPRRPAAPPDGLIGCSPALDELRRKIAQAADLDVPVLITGESGTGKELVARAIHAASAPFGAPFLALNCSTVSETLLESELFGHEKGAFTGADQRRAGAFESAGSGTLFLDEVADMSPAMQAKLLRVLEERQVQPVGGVRRIPVRCRFITASNKDLDAAMTAGLFRADLYERLAWCPIRVPPLRDRQDDIPLLTDYFLRRFCSERLLPLPEVSELAMHLLQQYSWPGNVRQLQRLLSQALMQGDESALLPAALPEELRRPALLPPADAAASALKQFVEARLAQGGPNLWSSVHSELDRALLDAALRQTGNHRLAAKILGISRNTFARRLKRRARHYGNGD